METYDELVARIAGRLDIDHQFYEDVQGSDADGVALIRKAGRAAARQLGWKVRTLTVDLESGDIRVFVVIIESTPEEDARIRERGDLLIREAFKSK